MLFSQFADLSVVNTVHYGDTDLEMMHIALSLKQIKAGQVTAKRQHSLLLLLFLKAPLVKPGTMIIMSTANYTYPASLI